MIEIGKERNMTPLGEPDRAMPRKTERTTGKNKKPPL